MDRSKPHCLIGRSSEEVREFINREQAALGLTSQGWSYLYGPERHLKTAEVLTVGLNPTAVETGVEDWEQVGNAYLYQDWTSFRRGPTLQRQIGSMFEFVLEEKVTAEDPRLSSLQYVPFPSASWGELPNKAECLAVGDRLFEWVLSRTSRLRWIVCFGKGELGPAMKRVAGAGEFKSEPLGWGRQAGLRSDGRDGVGIVLLPHLSRFTLFGRPQSQKALEGLFAADRVGDISQSRPTQP